MNEQDVYSQLIQDIKTTKNREMSYRNLAVNIPALGEFLEPVIENFMRDVIAMQDAAAAIKRAFPKVK